MWRKSRARPRDNQYWWEAKACASITRVWWQKREDQEKRGIAGILTLRGIFLSEGSIPISAISLRLINGKASRRCCDEAQSQKAIEMRPVWRHVVIRIQWYKRSSIKRVASKEKCASRSWRNKRRKRLLFIKRRKPTGARIYNNPSKLLPALRSVASLNEAAEYRRNKCSRANNI